jgi:hypothetical protein
LSPEVVSIQMAVSISCLAFGRRQAFLCLNQWKKIDREQVWMSAGVARNSSHPPKISCACVCSQSKSRTQGRVLKIDHHAIHRSFLARSWRLRTSATKRLCSSSSNFNRSRSISLMLSGRAIARSTSLSRWVCQNVGTCTGGSDRRILAGCMCQRVRSESLSPGLLTELTCLFAAERFVG